MSNNGPSQEIGAPIPSNTPHAVSVTLPTWEATVGYEEGEDWVVNKMSSGYPRFFIHSVIQDLANILKQNMVEKVKDVWYFLPIVLLKM